MCSHAGCAEAKLIYLHLKTCSCSALDVRPCPTGQKGCADARKLLNHYRRCREIRSRQVATRSRDSQHVCLVCSLVARHAKSFGERNRSTSPKPMNSRDRHLIPSLNLNGDMTIGAERHSRPRARSTSPHRDVQSTQSLFMQKHGVAPNASRAMHPPPPKFKILRQKVAVTFDLDTIEDNRGGHDNDWRQRPRAESLDIRYSQHKQSEHDRSQTSLGERPEDSELPSATIPHRRQRSASCSVLSPSRESGSGPKFDPILEEPVGEELQQVFESD